MAKSEKRKAESGERRAESEKSRKRALVGSRCAARVAGELLRPFGQGVLP